MTVKDPAAPATPKQIAFIQTLAAERGVSLNVHGYTKGQASAKIEELMAMPKAQPLDVPAKVDLAAVAQFGMAAVKQAPDGSPVEADDNAAPSVPTKATFTLDAGQAKTVLSWAGVADAEIGLDAAEDELCTLLRAFIEAPKAPQVEQAAKAAARLPEVPEGHYAITGGDGTTDFYRVQIGKSGKWDGFVFLSQQVSDDYVPVKAFTVKKVILQAIAADPLEAAKRYGTELGVCGVCHKTLTDPQSIADGIGPVCKAKLGG